MWFFFFQAEDGIRDVAVTGVQTCALPIFGTNGGPRAARLRRAAVDRTRHAEPRRGQRLTQALGTRGRGRAEPASPSRAPGAGTRRSSRGDPHRPCRTCSAEGRIASSAVTVCSGGASDTPSGFASATRAFRYVVPPALGFSA